MHLATRPKWSPPVPLLLNCGLFLHHRYAQFTRPIASGASSLLCVAHRQVVGTAMLLIIAASGLREGAARPSKAESEEITHAAACGTSRALYGTVTVHGLRARGRGRGCRRGFRRVDALLNGVRGLHSNATQTFCSLSIPTDLNISAIAPFRTPGVLYHPIRDMICAIEVTAVAHNKDTVVELCSALGVIKHATYIQLECALVSFDGYRNRLMCYSLFKSDLVVRRDVFIAINGDHMTIVAVGIASAIFRYIWVVLFCVNATVIDYELESVVHEATVAPIILSLVTINKLLLGQVLKLASDDSIDAFNGTSGGKCPAGTAHLLVLYLGYSTLGAPVDFLGGSSSCVAEGGGRGPETVFAQIRSIA